MQNESSPIEAKTMLILYENYTTKQLIPRAGVDDLEREAHCLNRGDFYGGCILSLSPCKQIM